ncbi:NAD-dependent dehydratase [Marinobacter salicampi]|uniref:NAD-dependent dehydratase n=1 Tax=Marinobacter salicampi TaxID=435907 RepID=UPI00140BA1A7|nr:NAD-dependent dehydratase [Marinobacter salicampi]
MKLMILGATGVVGSRVLEQALASDKFETIVAPTRRPLADPRKAHNPVIPFTLPLPGADWWAVDGVICCLGTTLKQAGSKTGFYSVDHDLVVACAGMAREAGASGFALNSSLGASPKSLSFYLQTKGKTESAIAGMGFQRFVVVRPSLIDAKREQPRLGESLGLMAGRLLSPITPRRYRPVSADAIAATLLREIGGPPGEIVIASEDISSCAT